VTKKDRVELAAMPALRAGMAQILTEHYSKIIFVVLSYFHFFVI